ncbi:hypothetical protein M378DRAFT_766007 [Amanita muscaria Koide BX008]|uniref:Uncharacterized protein n=1 Tax=Amanita muscaria (strain Koide BX008) TaxID=946122 RepID=A0A0C2XI41_AMAMK|nr:hypothetical protein M378DRAFT_766007 [Amanita muscaria Koide BX008]
MTYKYLNVNSGSSSVNPPNQRSFTVRAGGRHYHCQLATVIPPQNHPMIYRQCRISN